MVVYMGKDQDENDELIEHGWKSDVWFHVDSLSSAHVYLRLPLEQAMICNCDGPCGCMLDMIEEEVQTTPSLLAATCVCRRGRLDGSLFPMLNDCC